MTWLLKMKMMLMQDFSKLYQIQLAQAMNIQLSLYFERFVQIALRPKSTKYHYFLMLQKILDRQKEETNLY